MDFCESANNSLVEIHNISQKCLEPHTTDSFVLRKQVTFAYFLKRT